jgi:hypothetical protein
LIYRLHKVTGIALLLTLFGAGVAISGVMIWWYKIIPGYLMAYDTDSMFVYGTSIFAHIDYYAAGVLMALFYDHVQWY